MTPFEEFVQNLALSGFNFWFLIKILFIIAFGLYLFFAIIIVRQVKIMFETLKGMLDWPIKLIAWVHLGIAVFIFILAFIIL